MTNDHQDAQVQQLKQTLEESNRAIACLRKVVRDVEARLREMEKGTSVAGANNRGHSIGSRN